MVTIAHEQNNICSKTFYTVLCMSRPLFCAQFAGHVVGSSFYEKEEKNALNDIFCSLIQEMTDYGGGIHLVKAAFPFNGRDEDEV